MKSFFRPAMLPFACAFLLISGCARGKPTPLTAGLRALESGSAENAVILLKQAVELEPDNASAHCNLALALWRSGEFIEAKHGFEKAASLAKTDPRPLEFLSAMLIKLGDWEEARSALDKACRRAPHDAGILNSMGVVEFRDGDPGLATVFFKQALSHNPRYAPALFNLGVALENSEPTAARRYFEDYLSFRDDFDQRRAERISDFMAEPDSKQHEDGAAPAPADTPEREDAVVGADQPASEAEASAERQAADSIPDIPQESDSGEQAEETSEQEPQEPEPVRQISNAQLAMREWNKGLELHKKGEWQAAASSYEKALSYDSRLVNAHYNLGLVYRELGRKQQALSCFRGAMRSQPDMVQARYMLGVTYRDLGRTDEAIRTFDEILQIQPDYANAHLLLGVLYRQHHRTESAKKHFRQYLYLAPDDPSADGVREWLRQAR